MGSGLRAWLQAPLPGFRWLLALVVLLALLVGSVPLRAEETLAGAADSLSAATPGTAGELPPARGAWASVSQPPGQAAPEARDAGRAERGGRVAGGASDVRDFTAARLRYQEAQAALRQGRREEAAELLGEATRLDPRFSAPHFARAWLLLRRGDVLALSECIEGLVDVLASFRGQSRFASNVLLLTDMALGLFLLWSLALLFLRYSPFLAHQLRAHFDARGHLAGRAWVVWVLVLAPFLWGLGLVPTFSFVFLVIWLYSSARIRAVLALLLVWFAAQGVASSPFGASLVGVDPYSRPALVERAAEEPADGVLLGDLDAGLRRWPGDADLLFARGLVLARQGRFRESLRSFQGSLAQRPDDARTLNNLACSHFRLGDADRAVAGFQKSAALDSTLGTAYHNLAQGYLRKLYFREAGEAMSSASRWGFEPSAFGAFQSGPVFYVDAGIDRLWELAWADRGRFLPTDLLAARPRWVGVPAEVFPAWAAGSLLLALLLSLLLRRGWLTYECSNCGGLACSTCGRSRDGSMLCHGCASTAKRAKSELVLSTLLRNRRRAAEQNYLARVRRLNRWVFGAGELYAGMRRRGVLLGLLLAACTTLLVTGGPLLRDPWLPGPASPWTFVRLVAAALLAVLALYSRFALPEWRDRKLHLHPDALARLADLVESKAVSKAQADLRRRLP